MPWIALGGLYLAQGHLRTVHSDNVPTSLLQALDPQLRLQPETLQFLNMSMMKAKQTAFSNEKH